MNFTKRMGQFTIAVVSSVCVYASWNAPTCTTTPVLDTSAAFGLPPETVGNAVIWTKVSYSNWQWIGPDGKTYHFKGTSSARVPGAKPPAHFDPCGSSSLVPPEPIIHLPTIPDNIDQANVVNLSQVQASDGSEIYLTTINGHEGRIGVKKSIYPKYKILSIIYAPPGSGSSVTHGSGSSVGSATSISNEFSDQISHSATIGIKGLGEVGFGSGWESRKTQENTIEITSLENGNRSYCANADGIDHDQDLVEIWLNPGIDLMFANPKQATWSLTNNPSDPISGQVGPNVVSLTIGQLLGRAPITNEFLLARLRREWSSDGALTGPGTDTDFFKIAQQNPFHSLGKSFEANAFIPNPDRFELAKCPTVNYSPAPATKQATSYSVQNGFGENRRTTETQSYSVSASASLFGAAFKLDTSGRMTWTDSITHGRSNSNTSSANLTIVQPPPDWAGPTEVVVYTDKIYGTFLFTYLK